MADTSPTEANDAPRWHPGSILLHPVSVIAIGLLLINDRVLKDRMRGPLPGKLSDVAAMVAVPILIVAVLELVSRRESSMRSAWVAAAATGAAFGLMKALDPVGDAYGRALGATRWLLLAPLRLVSGGSVGRPVNVVIVHDTSDVIAVPFVLLAVWVAYRSRRPTPASSA